MRQRENILAIGDRVVVRKCARQNKAQFSGSIPMTGYVVAFKNGKAVVNCDGELVERIVGQVEYCPSERTIAKRASALKHLAIQKLRER